MYDFADDWCHDPTKSPAMSTNAGNTHTRDVEKAPTASYSRLIPIDLFSAVASAAPCAAVVCILDQAVTQNASGTATMANSLKQSLRTITTQPRAFFGGRAYLAVASVYCATYVAANTVMTWTEKAEVEDPSAYKLAATSAVNIAAGVTKDSMFAIWFGAAGAIAGGPLSFPMASWGMFILRDVMTIGAGMVLPEKVGASLHESKLIESRGTANVFAQLTVPMVAQTALVPIHLIALDIYNRPGKSMSNRWESMRKLYSQSLAVRVGRVACVYGIAGIGNTYIRTFLREKTEGVNRPELNIPDLQVAIPVTALAK